MKVNVYFAGISPIGTPWQDIAPADHAGHNKRAEEHVRAVSKGCPVYRVTVDVPDEALSMQPVIIGDDVVAEPADDLSVAA